MIEAYIFSYFYMIEVIRLTLIGSRLERAQLLMFTLQLTDLLLTLLFEGYRSIVYATVEG